MPALDLFELASELLIQAAAALDEEAQPAMGGDPAIEGAPDRRVVVVGQPAFDCCEQLAVGVSPPGVGFIQMGDQSQLARGVACATVTEVPLRVTLTACVPGPAGDGGPPSARAINLSAVALYARGWTLWCGLRNRTREGVLFSEGQPRRAVNVGTLQPIDPQGGCAGWTFDVTVQLDPDPELGVGGS